MASQAPVPRSMPAGDMEEQPPAQDTPRRSARVRSNAPTGSTTRTVHRPTGEAEGGTPGPRKKSPGGSWGEMGSSESVSSFSSRVVAMLREYEDAGKALTQLKEELREARILNTRASKKERPVTSQRFKTLKDKVERLVLLREGIEKSAGPFLERFKNQRRFSEMKGGTTSGELLAGVLSDEEEEEEDGVPCAGAQVLESQENSLPAGQMTPTPDTAVPGEEDGGLLQEIRELESPVNLDQFSFGEDIPAEESKGKRRKSGGAAREVVSYKYVPMSNVAPATSCVNPTKPKGTDSEVGLGRGQGGERRRTSGNNAICAGNSAGGKAMEVLMAPDIGDTVEFPSLPSAAMPVVAGAGEGRGNEHTVARGGRCEESASPLAVAAPADAGAAGSGAVGRTAAKGGRCVSASDKAATGADEVGGTVVTGAQCTPTEKRHVVGTCATKSAGRTAATGGQCDPEPK